MATLLSEKEIMDKNYAASEGRDFLASVIWGEDCDWDPDDLEDRDDDCIIDWLEDLEYEWTGGSWKAA